MSLGWAWLGRVPYAEALQAQRDRREAILAGQAPEILWALEHAPVLTTGRRAPAGLPDRAALASRGVDLHETERGGLATWHGPGQLVVYALIDAGRRGLGVRGLVTALEQGVITWLGAQGLPAGRREGYPGVWVQGTSPAGLDKICAVGLHFRRGVSMHGLALNLTADLGAYRWFTPCGITDAGVTRLVDHRPDGPAPQAAAPGLCAALIAAIEPTRGVG